MEGRWRECQWRVPRGHCHSPPSTRQQRLTSCTRRPSHPLCTDESTCHTRLTRDLRVLARVGWVQRVLPVRSLPSPHRLSALLPRRSVGEQLDATRRDSPDGPHPDAHERAARARREARGESSGFEASLAPAEENEHAPAVMYRYRRDVRMSTAACRVSLSPRGAAAAPRVGCVRARCACCSAPCSRTALGIPR